MRSSLIRLGLFGAAGTLAIDQATKALARSFYLQPEMPQPILPFFNLTLAHNTGVSFGLLKGMPAWALILMALSLIVVLGVMLRRSENRLTAAAVGLIIGGATGNVLDRISRGAVTDFLDFHFQGSHWPAFNFADVGIVCGVAFFLLATRRIQTT